MSCPRGLTVCNGLPVKRSPQTAVQQSKFQERTKASR
uniref:Uncharacterized protein n=1 Tax=Anguilla anguilla TaxID=7936 RepID=A0A0E9WCF8_ANGAN